MEGGTKRACELTVECEAGDPRTSKQTSGLTPLMRAMAAQSPHKSPKLSAGATAHGMPPTLELGTSLERPQDDLMFLGGGTMTLESSESDDEDETRTLPDTTISKAPHRSSGFILQSRNETARQPVLDHWCFGCDWRSRYTRQFFDERERTVHFVSSSGLSISQISVGPGESINRIPGMHAATTKCTVSLALRRLTKRPLRGFEPRTWVLPQDEALLTAAQHKEQLGWLIVKTDGGKCGDQIEIGTAAEGIVDRWRAHGSPSVMQALIAPPLLYMGKYKFDLRLYVLVTEVSPMTAYLATKGLARICAVPWEPTSGENSGNMQMHLSNAAIAACAEEKEMECKQPLGAVFAQLRTQGVDIERVWKDIKVQVGAVLQAIGPSLVPRRMEHTHQILGFDFMLDAEHTVWYLETNARPSFKIDGDADMQVKPQLVRSTLDVVMGDGETNGFFEPVEIEIDVQQDGESCGARTETENV